MKSAIAKSALATRLALGKFTPFLSAYWSENEAEAVNAWLSGVTFPKATEELEIEIASLLGLTGVVRTVNYGRSAIQLALESMKLPPNSEVLLPSFGCTGLVMPIIQLGLRPVFVDVDENFNISYKSVLKANSTAVKAIIICHLSGLWAKDTDLIIDWARKQGVFVIEDAAQALGLKYQGKYAGTRGDVGIFSCHLGKAIHSSGGGWLVTRDPKISENLSRLRPIIEDRALVKERLIKFINNYSVSVGSRGRQLLINTVNSKLTCNFKNEGSDLSKFSFNIYSMSDIEAKLIILQLKKLSAILDQRHSNALMWSSLLAKACIGGVRHLPMHNNIFVKMLIFGPNSNTFASILWNNGVELEGSYTPLHLRKSFSRFRRTSMETTEAQWMGAKSLPVRPNLSSADWNRIGEAVLRAGIQFKST
jgi:dTDP-4-amino-4,6-dideoxygalactose transaminase